MRPPQALALTLLVLATGCAKPEAQIVGKWQMDAGAASGGNAQTDAMFKSVASALTIEFKADKTYTAPMMEGTYDMSGHTVTMKPTKVMGIDVSKIADQNGAENKPMTATLSDDGKTLTTNDGKQAKLIKAG